MSLQIYFLTSFIAPSVFIRVQQSVISMYVCTTANPSPAWCSYGILSSSLYLIIHFSVYFLHMFKFRTRGESVTKGESERVERMGGIEEGKGRNHR